MDIRKETVDRYVWECPICGKEQVFSSFLQAITNSQIGRCSECHRRWARVRGKALWYRENRWLFGARILQVQRSDGEVIAILVEGTDGVRRVFRAEGWDERYIGISEARERWRS